MSSLLKEAEKNVVKTARAFEDVLAVLDALCDFGNRACNDYIGQKDFFEGLSKIRMGIYKEYQHALSKCFVFADVGGEEVKAYSREKFKEYFDEESRKVVMQFLGDFGHIPSSWKISDEKQFRKEAKDKLEK
jgi:hypothetical protein